MLLTVLKPGHHPEHASSYVAVKAIDVHGTWPIKDLIAPEQLAKLAKFTNKLEAPIYREVQ